MCSFCPVAPSDVPEIRTGNVAASTATPDTEPDSDAGWPAAPRVTSQPAAGGKDALAGAMPLLSTGVPTVEPVHGGATTRFVADRTCEPVTTTNTLRPINAASAADMV